MPFPTDGYNPHSLTLRVQGFNGLANFDADVTFPLNVYGGDGITEAAYEEAVDEAIDAFVNRVQEEFVSPLTVQRIYSGVKQV
jgi:hypothetical protein